MRSTLATVALFAATVLAQANLGLPTCAQSCITNYGGCSQVDVKCICLNTSLIAGLACCVSKQCDAADQQSVINFANSICKAYTTGLPQSATCASGVSYTGTMALSTSSSSSGTASSSSSASTTDSSSASSSSAASTSAASVTAASTSASGSSTSATHTPSGAAVARSAEHYGLGLALAGLMAAL